MAIRIGLIGAGRSGRAHLETLASFPDVEIAGVCDSDRNRAATVGEPFGASIHINFRTLLEAERLDAVWICVPPFARGEPEQLAARAGIHLFVDGPVALSVQKAQQIHEEVEKSGVVASVAYPWRYLSCVDRVREGLEGKRIAVVSGRRFAPVPKPGWRRKCQSSGGLFVHEATDLVDLARYLVGDIVSVSARSVGGMTASRLDDYDIEDAVTAMLHFREGAVGEVTVSNVAPREETSLSVIADRLEFRITPHALETAEPGKLNWLADEGLALRAAQEAFLDAVRTGDASAVRCDYADALRTLEVALAAVESAQTAKTVNL